MPGEKTEDPTDKRLRDLRRDGKLCTSQEVPAAMVVLAVFAFVWMGYDWASRRLTQLFELACSMVNRPFDEALATLAKAGGETLLLVSLSCVLIAAAAGAVGFLGQHGVVFAMKAIEPSLDKLNPKQWFSRVFSLRNLIDFIRNVLKVLIIVLVFLYVIADVLPLMLRLPGVGLRGLEPLLGVTLRRVALISGACFAAIAAADWLFQRWLYIRENRMSKDEVKNEYKQMEGDPHIKGQRRQLAQEIAMSDNMEGARKADVLIVNPTHIAIAIEYKKEKNSLPVILAKGEDHVAKRMIEAAEEAGVPVMRNVPLARDLWELGREMEYIPSDLIEPVAEVLRWLEELRSEGR